MAVVAVSRRPTLFTLATTLLNIFNHWWRAVPEPHPLPQGGEPPVGIIIPCCGEPVPMVLRTVTSVLEQDWPRERMVIVVSDDGHDPALADALRVVAGALPLAAAALRTRPRRRGQGGQPQLGRSRCSIAEQFPS